MLQNREAAPAPLSGINAMPARNHILRALPADTITALGTLVPVELTQHTVLHEMDVRIDAVYFIESGMVSLLVSTQSGDVVETGIVGTDGMVGSEVFINGGTSLTQATVQLPGRAMKVSAAQFMRAVALLPALQEVVKKQLALLLYQSQQNSACHALHSLDARLCRWILQAQDTLGTQPIELTQEFLSHILGVQRTSVSLAAHRMQAAGFIQYTRGKITIVDRAALEECACDCYGLIKKRRAPCDAFNLRHAAHGLTTARG